MGGGHGCQHLQHVLNQSNNLRGKKSNTIPREASDWHSLVIGCSLGQSPWPRKSTTVGSGTKTSQSDGGPAPPRKGVLSQEREHRDAREKQQMFILQYPPQYIKIGLLCYTWEHIFINNQIPLFLLKGKLLCLSTWKFETTSNKK